MSFLSKLMLGLNTTVIGMVIVFIVLIALMLIIKIETKTIGSFTKKGTINKEPIKSSYKENNTEQKTEKHGTASGDMIVQGVDNDEILAVIMSSVSEDADIPLSELKIKSVKRI